MTGLVERGTGCYGHDRCGQSAQEVGPHVEVCRHEEVGCVERAGEHQDKDGVCLRQKLKKPNTVHLVLYIRPRVTNNRIPIGRRRGNLHY